MPPPRVRRPGCTDILTFGRPAPLWKQSLQLIAGLTLEYLHGLKREAKTKTERLKCSDNKSVEFFLLKGGWMMKITQKSERGALQVLLASETDTVLYFKSCKTLKALKGCHAKKIIF